VLADSSKAAGQKRQREAAQKDKDQVWEESLVAPTRDQCWVPAWF